MKNIKKLIKVFLIVLACFMSMSVFVYATGEDPETLKEAYDKVLGFASFVTAFLRYVGAGFAVVILVIYGFKFTTGSPQERATLKDKLINYVIGVGLLILGPWLAEIVVNIIIATITPASITEINGDILSMASIL